MFKRFLIAAALLANSVSAEEPSDRLRTMLGHIPADAIQDGAQMIEWGDTRTYGPTALLLSGDPENAALFSFARALPAAIAPYGLLLFEEMQAAVGVSPDAVIETFYVGAPPDEIMILKLSSGAGEEMAAALEVAGYALDNSTLSQPLWTRGEDNEIDFAFRNAANPFGGAIGRAGRIAIENDLLTYAPTWPLIEAALSTGSDTLADDPQITSLLDAMDAVGQGGLVSVHIYPGLGDQWGSPAILVADFAFGPIETGLLAVAVPESLTAQDMASRISRNWSEKSSPLLNSTYAGVIDVAPIIQSHAGGMVPVVTITLTLPAETTAVNAAARLFERGFLSGDLPTLVGE